MKKIVFTLILLAVVASSCNKTESAILSEEQKQSIIAEIEAVDAAISDHLNSRNAAGAFSKFSEDNFLRFIDNGYVMTDLNSIVSVFTERFARFNSLSLQFADRQYSVLSPTLVLSTSSFTEEVVTLDGDTMNLKGAMTTLFHKGDDAWQVLHVHQSYFPVNN